MAKVTAKDELTEMISMRLTQRDLATLEEVAERVPAIPRLTLARLAMRLGLEVIRNNPAEALAPAKVVAALRRA